eukprot:762433-Hanusia_phi.AAC.23
MSAHSDAAYLPAMVGMSSRESVSHLVPLSVHSTIESGTLTRSSSPTAEDEVASALVVEDAVLVDQGLDDARHERYTREQHGGCVLLPCAVEAELEGGLQCARVVCLRWGRACLQLLSGECHPGEGVAGLRVGQQQRGTEGVEGGTRDGTRWLEDDVEWLSYLPVVKVVAVRADRGAVEEEGTLK